MTLTPSAATGSAHHQPNSAFRPIPARTTMDRYQHAWVCSASAASARLPSSAAVRRLARASHSITPIEMAVTAIPRGWRPRAPG